MSISELLAHLAFRFPSLHLIFFPSIMLSSPLANVSRTNGSTGNTLEPSSPPTSQTIPRSRSSVVTSGADHHLIDESYDSPIPPYATAGDAVAPFFIGVSGASASGKTTVCRKIIHGLGDQRCILISMDWFYKGLPPGVDPAKYNFDHPDAFDYEGLVETLAKMKERQAVSVPKYDFALHQRSEDNCEEFNEADVIILEGILTFHDKAVRDMLHMKIFVDEDADVCLVRRISRDVKLRGRSVESVLKQYTKFVKPAFEEYIYPTKRFCDIVVPRGGENLVAIDLIIKHSALKIKQGDTRRLYSNLIIMADSYQMRGLHTIIRSQDCPREDLIFYSNRLMRLLIEEALGLLPFERKTITTHTGSRYYGVGFTAGLLGLSLIPAGEAMESSLRAVCKTIRIGKILITDEDGTVGEHFSPNKSKRTIKYISIPPSIEGRHVLLLAPVVNTGAACELAIEKLLSEEVGCKEENIIILSLIVSPESVKRICGRFTKARMVVSAIDHGIDEVGSVTPGIGDFSARYYGADRVSKFKDWKL